MNGSMRAARPHTKTHILYSSLRKLLALTWTQAVQELVWSAREDALTGWYWMVKPPFEAMSDITLT